MMKSEIRRLTDKAGSLERLAEKVKSQKPHALWHEYLDAANHLRQAAYRLGIAQAHLDTERPDGKITDEAIIEARTAAGL